MGWFEVDRQGLREIWAVKGKTWILRELIQNSYDEPGVSVVDVTLESIEGRRGRALLRIQDNAPEGFYEIRHAFTLFAHTRKREDPEKRGRYNLGDKLVLSFCERAELKTTSGSIIFEPDGTRRRSKKKTEVGSVWEFVLPMTRKEIAEAKKEFETFISPCGITTMLNGKALPLRIPVAKISATLLTEKLTGTTESGDRVFSTTRRKTEIHVYEPKHGETAQIYELGLPVQETGDRWSYDVRQRVPLTVDREQVRPAYLQDVRTVVLNQMAEELTKEDASEAWVREATADPDVEEEAVSRVMDLRYGEKRLVVGPGTSERQKEEAISSGHRLVHASEMSRNEWAQVREARAIPSVESTFPEIAVEAEIIPKEKWTLDNQKVVTLAKRLAELLLGFSIRVVLIRSKADIRADYSKSSRTLRFNLSKLRERWWYGPTQAKLRLILHKLGHHYGGHLSMEAYDGLAKMGAILATMEPDKIFG